MRAASTLHRSDQRRSAESPTDERCPDCRGGLVCADQWEAWLSRRDDAEQAWAAEHGSLDAFEASPEFAELLDDRPGCEEEIECGACGGTGQRAGRTSSRRSHAA